MPAGAVLARHAAAVVSVLSGASPAFLLQPGAVFAIAEDILTSMDPSQPLHTYQAPALFCLKAATPFLFVPRALTPPLPKAPSPPLPPTSHYQRLSLAAASQSLCSLSCLPSDPVPALILGLISRFPAALPAASQALCSLLLFLCPQASTDGCTHRALCLWLCLPLAFHVTL